MRWLELAEVYLRGKKLEALIFILPMGLVSLVFGAWLLTDVKEAFARGVAVPCLILGLALLVTGATVGFRTPAQVSALQRAAQADAEAARQAEIVRMAGVNKAWPIYLGAWASFGVVGLLLRFASRNETAPGVGVSLVFFAGVGLLIDGFAERRAIPYTEALRADGSGPHP
jgi:hypothetical protein